MGLAEAKTTRIMAALNHEEPDRVPVGEFFWTTFGSRWAFNGNIDVRVLATNDRRQVRREVLRKLNAAKGGGFILQSDHSVPNNVAPATYDYLIHLAREYGTYPLELGEFDEKI